MFSNGILDNLDPDVGARIFGGSRQFNFRPRESVIRLHEPIVDIIFPTSGALGLVVEFSNGNMLTTIIVGHEGAVGAEATFGLHRHSCTAIGQIAGSGWLVPTTILTEAAKCSPRLKSLLFSQIQHMTMQAQRTAACNARHSLIERLATWLLRVAAAARSDELLLTQADLTGIVGSTRPSISTAASGLADAGAIEYRRGKIHILQKTILQSYACECHQRFAAPISGASGTAFTASRP